MNRAQGRLALMGGAFGIELVALAFVYQIVASLDCSAAGSIGLCLFLGSLIARAVAVIAAVLLVLWAFPSATATLLARIADRRPSAGWLLLHLAGVGLLFVPILLANGQDLALWLPEAIVPWVAGGLALVFGGLAWLAAPAAWAGWLRLAGWPAAAAVTLAFFLPDIAERTQPLWEWPALTSATFDAAAGLLGLFGLSPEVFPEERAIAVGDFAVSVARACSGVEGLALVTTFALLYLLLFRAELRVRRFLLVMVPAALLLSWAFNVLRIAALVAIGATLSPALAVGGFHSYAGWMAFTLLALALLVAAHMIPWFRRTSPAPARPWREDWSVACILPFIAVTLADVLIAMALPDPALGYPLKVLVGAAALFPFRTLLARLPWSPDPLALLVGVAVAIGWIAFAPPAVPVTGIAALAPAAFVAWALLRIVGTALVVPVVEELFSAATFSAGSTVGHWQPAPWASFSPAWSLPCCMAVGSPRACRASPSPS